MVAAVIKRDEEVLGARLTVSTICTRDDSILSRNTIDYSPVAPRKAILDRDLACDWEPNIDDYDRL